ncbi:unnamed protein product [Mytilus edulis]|uniref:Uncharacterized protein n=1 Tax=Mytilus edulis TaxID=6550 RepID=A0A8S3UJ68_MYTED|nr:unnamed protein product [Mytilus edulis]
MYLVSLNNIQDNTREENLRPPKSSLYVSLDNIQDNTREEKGCCKSSCTSYHWTTYRITLVKKKDVINLMYLVSLDNIQDNTREEKGIEILRCHVINNTREEKDVVPHVSSLDNIHDNTREEKGCYKSSCTSYHWTTCRITLVREKGCYKSSCTSYHWTTYRITLT